MAWFKKNAFEPEHLRPGRLRPMIWRLTMIADEVGFDFRAEVAKISAWLEANPKRRPKSNWERFWINCFSKARADGQTKDKNHDKDMARWKR